MTAENKLDRLHGLAVAIDMLDREATALGLEEVGNLLGCAKIALEDHCGDTLTFGVPHLRLVPPGSQNNDEKEQGVEKISRPTGKARTVK